MVDNPEEETLIRRPRHKWEDNINMNIKKTVCEYVE
jgi:hypothetical protein